MRRIVYSGIYNGTLKHIKNVFQSKNDECTELPRANYKIMFKNNYVDALILGENIDNPISLAQEVYKMDRNLSIIIIIDPHNYASFKKALQFIPFIGNTVLCIPNIDLDVMTLKIENELTRTGQRRSYNSLKKSLPHISHQVNHDQVQKEYLHRFFDYAPIGAMLLDQKGTIVASNHYLSKIFDRPEKEILGQNLYSFFKEGMEEVIQYIQKGFKTQERKLFNTVNSKCLELSFAEIMHQKGYKVGIVEDVTEKIDKLNELKSLNSDLDNFIYTASHDLKAPISNIEGLANALEDLLSEEDFDKNDASMILNLIKTSIQRFKNTIQDLTEVTKLQRIGVEDLNEINIKQSIDEVLADIHLLITQNGAEIIYDSCVDFNIRFSKSRFRSIIYNLITNAIKYRSPERSPKVTIKCSQQNSNFVIKISDNGLGLNTDQKDKLFVMFKRFHDHVEGSGMGLYIVKRNIVSTGGKIEVDSIVGVGTTFTIHLKI